MKPQPTALANAMSENIEAQALIGIHLPNQRVYTPHKHGERGRKLPPAITQARPTSHSHRLPRIFHFTQPHNPYSNPLIEYFLLFQLLCMIVALLLGEVYFTLDSNSKSDPSVLYPILGIALVLGVLSGAPSMG